MPFDRDASETLLQMLRRVSKKASADADKVARKLGQGIDNTRFTEATDTELLRASAFLFTTTWLDDLLQRTLNPTLPQMCNTHGDEIAFTTVSYPLKPNSATSVRKRNLLELDRSK